MFHEPTVFVIGAGASAEFNLPVGNCLANSIHDLLDFDLDEFGKPRNHTKAAPILDVMRNSPNRDTTGLNHAAKLIFNGVQTARSVDEFLERHDTSPMVSVLGKQLIATAILDAEENSRPLFVEDWEGEPFRPSQTAQTWIGKLFKVMAQGVKPANISDFFQNVTFIAFNYDRCLEQYFYHALRAGYDISQAEAEQLINMAEIIHPYGSVGSLWLNPASGIDNVCVPFGGRRSSSSSYHRDLRLGEQIQTYGEAVFSVSAAKISQLMAEASTWVFLGFAFHHQNTGLLEPSGRANVQRVFGTALGVSNDDAAAIRNDILQLASEASLNVDDIRLRTDLEASRIFDEYSRSLAGNRQ